MSEYGKVFQKAVWCDVKLLGVSEGRQVCDGHQISLSGVSEDCMVYPKVACFANNCHTK